MRSSGLSRLGLRVAALGYLAALVILPVGWIIWRAFGGGAAAAWSAASDPLAVHALELSLEAALVAVAVNTVFGVILALMIVRHPFPGVSFIDSLVNIPLGLSPVVVGLSLLLVYGQTGWLGPWLLAHGIRVIYSLPAIILATTFVTLPFVVREVVPVIREVGTRQEEAAQTLGASGLYTFWKITLPSIRAGVIYGVVLTMARALGEFGAVSVVAGGFIGVTQTATMYVEYQSENYNPTAEYVASLELAALAILTLLALSLTKRRKSA